MKYAELIAKLKEVELATGVYLVDECVDRENVMDIEDFRGLSWDGILSKGQDDALCSAAGSAAGSRSEEAGLDLNKLLGFIVY